MDKRLQSFDDGVEQTITSFSAGRDTSYRRYHVQFSKTLVYYLDNVFTPIAGFVRSLKDDVGSRS
jgi:hypothetical protein